MGFVREHSLRDSCRMGQLGPLGARLRALDLAQGVNIHATARGVARPCCA